jgi:hypothetical protein
MKVLVTQDFLATRSTASKSRLSILEPAGPRLPPYQPCLEVLADEIVAKNFFCFTCFHGLSAASPLGWALRMTSGKVSVLQEHANELEHGAFPVVSPGQIRVAGRPGR